MEIVRYSDKISENISLTKWIESLNLTDVEEIGILLWANAQHLIIESKLDQEKDGFEAPPRDVTILIQLYNQLKVIENLGLTDLRKRIGLPEEDEIYLKSEKIKEKAINLCNDLMAWEEDGYEDLDFDEFIANSHSIGIREHKFSLESDEEV